LMQTGFHYDAKLLLNKNYYQCHLYQKDCMDVPI